MTFIENPMSFFEKIERLAKSLCNFIEEREDADQGLFFFNTSHIHTDDRGESAPLIRSLCVSKQEESEIDDDSPYELLHLFHLCQFSLDNINFCDMIDANNNEVLASAFKGDIQSTSFKLYIRDITQNFYTVITSDTIGYFQHIYNTGIVTEKYIDEDDYMSDEPITLYYHNLCLAFYIFRKKYDIDIAANEIDTVTYAAFRKNEYDDIYWELTSLKIEDLFPDREDFLSDSLYYPELQERLTEVQNKYIEDFKAKPQEVNLFGKLFSFSFDPNRLSVSTLSQGLEYFLSNDEYIAEASKELFEKLIKDTVAESNGFDPEKFAENFKTASELYWGINSTLRSRFRNAYKDNPKTALVSVIWDVMISLKVFEEQVIGVNEIIQDPSFLASQLPSLLYVDSFLSTMYEGYEVASKYKEDIDNFGNGFELYGGGTGLGGAAKGILAASLFSAVAQTAYSAYKSSKFDSKKYEVLGKEFMISNASQAFFKELIEEDLVYLILKCFSLVNIRLNEVAIFKKHENHINYEAAFESYIKAYKLYTIALAKHLNLAFLPIYEGFEESYSKSSVELMQEALLVFPYYAKYYEKYLEFGGDISEELKTYALAHMVDLSTLYEKEKERIEKRKQEEAERQRKEAEQKRLEEEKRKAEEERIRSELSALSEIYGDLVTRYPDMFKLLIDNPIYTENKNVEIVEHTKIPDIILSYVASKHSNGISNLFSGTSDKFNSKKGNIKTIHGADKIKDNNVLMLFDTTVFGSAKDGFVITNENICVRNSFEQPFAVAIKDVKQITTREKYLLINDKYKIDVGVSCVTPLDFVHIFSYCVCNLLYLAEKGYQIAPLSDTAVPNQSSATNDNQFISSATGAFKTIFGKISSTLESVTTTKTTWKCECGKDIPSENKFCPNCGTKQPEVTTEWVCSSCGKQNPKESNFCGHCGTKKNM